MLADNKCNHQVYFNVLADRTAFHCDNIIILVIVILVINFTYSNFTYSNFTCLTLVKEWAAEYSAKMRALPARR